MKRQTILCSLICALGLIGTTLSADDGQVVAVTGGGALLSDSGDENKLLEDYGLDSGLAIDTIRYDWARDDRTFRVDGFLTPAGEGWLRARYAAPSGWTMRLGLEQSRKWSDTSVGAPVTAYGTPLSNFFPGDNTTGPAFGKDEVLLERQNAWFDVMIPITAHGTLSFGGGSYTQDGDLTLVSRGSAFADFNTLGFNTPALGDFDLSRDEWFARFDWETTRYSFGAGFATENRDDEVSRAYPTFGTSSLLDVYTLRDRFDTDTNRAELDGSIQLGPAVVYGSYRWMRADADPMSSQLAASAAGMTLSSRSTVGATTELERQVTTLGTVLDLGSNVVVRLSAIAGKDDRDGSGTELRNGFGGALTSTWVSTSAYETKRSAAKAELTWNAAWLRVRAGYELDTRERTAATEILKDPAIFPARIAQASERDTDRGRGWLRMRIPFGPRKAIALGVDRVDTESDVSITDLENNYVTGPWDQEMWRYQMEVPIVRSGGTDVTLRYDGSDATTTLGAPEFDPLFDPSELPEGVEHESSLQSAELRLYRGEGTWCAWTGLGWRKEESEFEPTLATFPGFIPSDYEIRGTSISMGGSVRIGEKGTLAGDGLWIRSERSVDNDRIDAGIAYRHELSEKLGVEARYRYVRFNEEDFDSDDYRGHLASIYLVGRF